MTIQHEIEEDAWEEKFRPQRNHLTSAAGWGGTLYETFGKEDAYIRELMNTEPGRVWTLVDDGDNLEITSGWHFVNRAGYFVTEEACPDGELYTVKVDNDFT